MTEIWKDIVGYDGLYQVSNLGRVRSLISEKILKASDNGTGYFTVGLHKDGKSKMRTVHRLVAEAFVSNPNNLPQVNHIDGCKSNNQVDNLEFCDNSHNMKHAYSLGLIERPYGRKQRSKRILCVELNRCFIDSIEASKELNINSAHIRDCCRGERKHCGGYTWRYA